MTPKEKAQELYLKMEATIWGFEVLSEKPKAIAKQCAIIAVDEILNLEELIDWDFWSDVKLEIDKL